MIDLTHSKTERMATMKTLVITYKKDFELICTAILESGHEIRKSDIHFVSDYDEMRCSLAEREYELVIVIQNGAAGMETCMCAKRMCPKIHVFWYSDDAHFGPQSYRIGCTYFATEPVTAEKLRKAFDRVRMEKELRYEG